MPISRQHLRNIPILGYLLSVGYSIMKLPPMWADLHRDVNNLHRSVLELKDAHGAIGKFNGLLTSGVVAQHSAHLTDHAAQFQEQNHELADLSERHEALDNSLQRQLAELTAEFSAKLQALEAEAGSRREEVAQLRGQIEALAAVKQEQVVQPPTPAAPVQAAQPAPVYLGNGRVLVRTDCNQTLICKSQDVQITPSLIYERIWDPPLTRFYQQNLKPGMTYLEIGANIGYFTVLGANLVGHLGSVHAFEPQPEAFALLELNCRLNNCSYICHLVQKAVSNHDGAQSLYTFEHNFPSATLSDLPQKLLTEFNEKPSATTVPCTTLDHHYAGRDTVFDFIKMDAEGAEPLIFEGARSFLDRCVTPQTIFAIEYNPQAITGLNRNPADFIGNLHAQGFHLWKGQPDGRLAPIYAPSDLDSWCNADLVLSRDSRAWSQCA